MGDNIKMFNLFEQKRDKKDSEFTKNFFDKRNSLNANMRDDDDDNEKD